MTTLTAQRATRYFQEVDPDSGGGGVLLLELEDVWLVVSFCGDVCCCCRCCRREVVVLLLAVLLPPLLLPLEGGDASGSLW